MPPLIHSISFVLQACGFALVLATAIPLTLDAQAAPHAAHDGHVPVAHFTMSSDAASPAAAVRTVSATAEAPAPDCCGGCPAPGCSMSAACGSSPAAVVTRPAPATLAADRRTVAERRVDSARSLTHRPPIPPPQPIG